MPYATGTQVIANCGTRDVPNWIVGTVSGYCAQWNRPYEVTFNELVDGALVWYFPARFVKFARPRNLKQHGLKG